jgi:hypothetical protein
VPSRIDGPLIPREPTGALSRSAVEASMVQSPDEPAVRPDAGWTVYRQDDNGNRFVVETGLSRAEAEQLVEIYERRGHKQVYWAAPDEK